MLTNPIPDPALRPAAAPARPLTPADPTGRPWYRQLWPWLLFTPPAVAVVAGLITMAIAIDTFDGVVSDDYYRQGLAINQTLVRDATARERAIAARVLFNPSGDQVRVSVSGRVEPGEELRLRLVRAARSGDDQDVDLAAIAPGLYAGRLAQPVSGRWHLQLEDRQLHWRVMATVQLPETAAIALEVSEQVR